MHCTLSARISRERKASETLRLSLGEASDVQGWREVGKHPIALRTANQRFVPGVVVFNDISSDEATTAGSCWLSALCGLAVRDVAATREERCLG